MRVAHTTAPRITHKETVFFNSVNHSRITQLIQAGRDPQLISRIPPSYFNIDITWRCNNNCTGCIDGSAVKRNLNEPDAELDMSWEMCRDLISYAKENSMLGAIIQGGEPLLHPRIDDFLYACADANLVLRMVTNGTKISEHLDAIAAAFSAERNCKFRVSVNTDESHYADFVRRSGADLSDVISGISALTSRGVPVVASTVYFGEQFSADGCMENISQLSRIGELVAEAGVFRWLLLPGRDPVTKSPAGLTEREMDLMENLPETIGNAVVVKSDRHQIEKQMPASAQNKDFAPCPASLLRVSVGSNGNLYSCTEHKGDERALVGKIAPPERSFSSVWHSIDRVNKQLAFDPRRECASITCDRYGINSTVEAARAGYEKFGCPSIIAHLLQDHDYTSDLFF